MHAVSLRSDGRFCFEMTLSEIDAFCQLFGKTSYFACRLLSQRRKCRPYLLGCLCVLSPRLSDHHFFSADDSVGDKDDGLVSLASLSGVLGELNPSGVLADAFRGEVRFQAATMKLL